MEFITGWYLESGIIYIYSTYTIIKRSITEFLQMHFSIKKTEWWWYSQFILFIKHHYSIPRRRSRWVNRIVCMRVMRNEYNISTGKREGKTICGW